MKLNVDEHGNIVLSEVYNAIVIKTDSGCYGIAQRDNGIEVVKDGVLLLAADDSISNLIEENTRLQKENAKLRIELYTQRENNCSQRLLSFGLYGLRESGAK